MPKASAGAYAPNSDNRNTASASQPGAQRPERSRSGSSALKKRPVALAIAASVVIASTLFGAGRSIAAECRRIEDGFYSGVYVEADGYYHNSIYSQLSRRCDAALGLISIAEGHPEVSEQVVETLREARLNLLFEMDYADIEYMYRTNCELTPAFERLLTILQSLELNEFDAEAVREYSVTFSGAQDVIDNAGYNESVRKFRRETLSEFPANFFVGTLDIDEPDFFE